MARPISMTSVLPPSATPKVLSGQFSVNTDTVPMKIRTDKKPLLFVKGEYGGPETQAQLKEQWIGGDEKPCQMYVTVPDKLVESVVKWAEAWEAWATAHVETTTQRSKRSKALALNRIVNVSDDGSTRMKITCSPLVVTSLAKSADLEKIDTFDLPPGSYDIAFVVGGIWKNATSFGVTLRALCVRLKERHEAVPKGQAPEDVVFESDEDEEGGDRNVKPRVE